jgi:hypothetical protein
MRIRPIAASMRVRASKYWEFGPRRIRSRSEAEHHSVVISAGIAVCQVNGSARDSVAGLLSRAHHLTCGSNNGTLRAAGLPPPEMARLISRKLRFRGVNFAASVCTLDRALETTDYRCSPLRPAETGRRQLRARCPVLGRPRLRGLENRPLLILSFGQRCICTLKKHV